MYLSMIIKVWEARVTKGEHMNETVALKEIDLEEVEDKKLENLRVKYFLY
jgi:hypothetical protein